MTRAMSRGQAVRLPLTSPSKCRTVVPRRAIRALSPTGSVYGHANSHGFLLVCTAHDPAMSADTLNVLRELADREHDLLNERTNMFLVYHSVLMAGFALGSSAPKIISGASDTRPDRQSALVLCCSPQSPRC